jgi:hypothetical protein
MKTDYKAGDLSKLLASASPKSATPGQDTPSKKKNKKNRKSGLDTPISKEQMKTPNSKVKILQANDGTPGEKKVNTPGGKVGTPGGKVGTPGGKVGSPGGKVGTPGGKVGTPSGKVSAPDGKGGTPDGKVGTPEGGSSKKRRNRKRKSNAQETPVNKDIKQTKNISSPDKPGTQNQSDGTPIGKKGKSFGFYKRLEKKVKTNLV